MYIFELKVYKGEKAAKGTHDNQAELLKAANSKDSNSSFDTDLLSWCFDLLTIYDLFNYAFFNQRGVLLHCFNSVKCLVPGVKYWKRSITFLKIPDSVGKAPGISQVL